MNRLYAYMNKEKKRDIISLFLAIFFLISIRFLYFGFEYFPQLDDYIQHHNYAPQGSFFYLVERLGLLGARPLAGILDITLWSWLWPCAIVGVLILSALYAFSAVKFQEIFEKLFGTSKFFIIVYALLPLGIEGTYWMSASTRIIPGMFFAALSASLLVKFLENGRKSEMVFALLLQFLTFCFYEQTAVLSCTLNVLIGLIYVKKSNGRWIFSFGCIFCAALYFLVTSIHSDSILYAGRGSIILPRSAYYFDAFLPSLLEQLKSAFLGGGYYTFVYGFIRGVMRIISDGAWLYCILLLVGCAFFGYVAFKKHSVKGYGRILLPIVIGLLLVIAPLAPFFIIENPWFSFRGTVPSFVGIALLIDVLIRLITRNKKHGIAVISSCVALVFCICAVSEIADYRATTEADMRVVGTVATIADELKEEAPNGCKVAIFNVDDRYVTELNSYYHEHIHGVTESDWAFTGAIRCYNDDVFEAITYVPISLRDAPTYKNWEFSAKSIGTMHAVYVYDYYENTIERLTVNAVDNTYELYYSDGEKYGTVVEYNDANGKYGIFVEE